MAIAGDTVRVLAGTYAETVKPNFGNSGNPVTFSAAPGVTVTGEAGNSTDGGGFRLYNCTPVCAGTSYVVIDGFTVTGTADHGIYASGSHRLIIRNNHVSYPAVRHIIVVVFTCLAQRIQRSQGTRRITTVSTVSG